MNIVLLHDEKTDCTLLIDELKKLNKPFEHFIDVDACRASLVDCNHNHRSIFIVVNCVGRDFVPEIHDLVDLLTIYILCTKTDNKTKWTNKFTKIKGVASNVQDLINSVECELDETTKSTTLSCNLIWLDDQSSTSPLCEQLEQLNGSLKVFDRMDLCEQYIKTTVHRKLLLLITTNSLGRQLVPEIHSNNQLKTVIIYCFTNHDQKVKWAKKFSKVQAIPNDTNQLLTCVKQLGCVESQINFTGDFPWHLLCFDDSNDKELYKQLQVLDTSLSNLNSIDLFEQCLAAVDNIKPVVIVATNKMARDIVPQIHENDQIKYIYIYCSGHDTKIKWIKHFPKVKSVDMNIAQLLTNIRKEAVTSNLPQVTITTNIPQQAAMSTRTRPAQLIQNFQLVWLDESIDEVNSDDCRNSITKLRQVVNTVNTFTDVDECIDFINSIEEEKVFIISSGALGHITVPVVHDKPQVTTICIFAGNKARHEKWAKEWPKVKGVYTDIIPICQALKQAAQDCDHNSVSISFVKTTGGASKDSLDTLDSSFMYTQILKEILLTIDFEQKHINELLTYCQEQFAGNTAELRNVKKLRREYRDHQPIWWYTYDSFLYSMLNRALRLMDVDLILKMGFFVRDLHNHIAELHAEQYGGHHHSNSFTVYRGQGLYPRDFDQVKQTQGGLLAFNNFLSTSLNYDVSLQFVRETIHTSDLVGVLFVMKIDPSITATPFANVGNVSFYKGEKEILFSMHSVFRIGQIKQIDKNDRLWQVDLILTGDSDPQLHALAECMREETSSGSKGWYRLGTLLIKLGQFDQAEELYEILLNQTANEGEKGSLYHMLGVVNDSQGKYAEAVEFYEKSIKIKQGILPPTHSDLAASYNNIGGVYRNMGEYSTALSYYEKALEIYQKTLPANHPSLATSYNNIGNVCYNMGEYSKALSYNEKALEIYQKTLPANHPSLATSYNNIGGIYNSMDEYSKALSYYEKDLEICQKTLPANHPSLAASYNNIGNVYYNMGEYSKALSYNEKALEIYQKTLPANHPSLATSYNNIGGIYNNMGEYSKALSYYERAFDIRQRSLPSNHPSIKDVLENIEIVKEKL